MYNIYQQATNELNMFLLNKVIHLSVAQTRVCLWFKETFCISLHLPLAVLFHNSSVALNSTRGKKKKTKNNNFESIAFLPQQNC